MGRRLVTIKRARNSDKLMDSRMTICMEHAICSCAKYSSFVQLRLFMYSRACRSNSSRKSKSEPLNCERSNCTRQDSSCAGLGWGTTRAPRSRTTAPDQRSSLNTRDGRNYEENKRAQMLTSGQAVRFLQCARRRDLVDRPLTRRYSEYQNRSCGGARRYMRQNGQSGNILVLHKIFFY